MMHAHVPLGTDHPFFPPLKDSNGRWPSVTTNYQAIDDVFHQDEDAVAAILGVNAVRILSLQ